MGLFWYTKKENHFISIQLKYKLRTFFWNRYRTSRFDFHSQLLYSRSYYYEIYLLIYLIIYSN